MTFKTKLAVLIAIVWFVGIFIVFWGYNKKYQNQFSQMVVQFDPKTISIKDFPEYSEFLVVNFIDPKCPCSKFAYPHVERLKLKYSKNVTFITPTTIDVPVTPSVAVYNAQRELIYFGPFSGGNICGQGEDLLSKVLNDPNKKLNIQAAVGCYCN